MNEMHADHEAPSHQANITWYQIGKWGAIGIMAYYLLTEHYAHVMGILPWLFILACPLMHLMHGHGGHGGHHHHNSEVGKEQK